MAKQVSKRKLLSLIQRESRALAAKRATTNNPEWKPSGRAGVLQERMWKKYAPKSSILTSHDKIS